MTNKEQGLEFTCGLYNLVTLINSLDNRNKQISDGIFAYDDILRVYARKLATEQSKGKLLPCNSEKRLHKVE